MPSRRCSASKGHLFCNLQIHSLFTSDKGGGICFRPHARVRLSVCLSVCKITQKRVHMDLDEMLRVDRCRDMDELINLMD